MILHQRSKKCRALFNGLVAIPSTHLASNFPAGPQLIKLAQFGWLETIHLREKTHGKPQEKPEYYRSISSENAVVTMILHQRSEKCRALFSGLAAIPSTHLAINFLAGWCQSTPASERRTTTPQHLPLLWSHHKTHTIRAGYFHGVELISFSRRTHAGGRLLPCRIVPSRPACPPRLCVFPQCPRCATGSSGGRSL